MESFNTISRSSEFVLSTKIRELAAEGLYTIFLWSDLAKMLHNPNGYIRNVNDRKQWPKVKKDVVDFVFYSKQLSNSQCEITSQALINVLIGPSNTTGLQSLSYKQFSEIHRNEEFHSQLSEEYYVYECSLSGPNLVTNTSGGSSSNRYPGHQFLIVQCKNNLNETRFMLLQSYVNHYSLENYLSREDIQMDFSREEFKNFIQGIDIFLKSKEWTKETSEFHEKYFKNSEDRFIDRSISSGEFKIEIKYALSSLSRLEENIEAFHRYQSTLKTRLIELNENDVTTNNTIFNNIRTSKIDDRQDLQLCYFEYPYGSMLKFADKQLVDQLLNAVNKKHVDNSEGLLINPESKISESKVPAREEPAREEPAREEPAREEPAREEPAREEPAREEPAREEPAREEPAREEPAREEPAREEPAREEPAREEPAREEPARDEPVQLEADIDRDNNFLHILTTAIMNMNLNRDDSHKGIHAICTAIHRADADIGLKNISLKYLKNFIIENIKNELSKTNIFDSLYMNQEANLFCEAVINYDNNMNTFGTKITDIKKLITAEQKVAAIAIITKEMNNDYSGELKNEKILAYKMLIKLISDSDISVSLRDILDTVFVKSTDNYVVTIGKTINDILNSPTKSFTFGLFSKSENVIRNLKSTTLNPDEVINKLTIPVKKLKPGSE